MAELDPLSPDLADSPESDQPEAAQQPTQVSYRPHSQGRSIQTVCPPTMATPMSISLDRVEAVTGQSIDQFVADRLGIDSETLFQRYAAEQIDCLSIAFLNQDRGRPTLIANDTGTGKGRIVSGVLSPILADESKIAVFITAKPDLYVDMLARDMVDTGVRDQVRPFFTNSGLNLELTSPDGEVLGTIETPSSKQHQADTRALIEEFKATGTLSEYNCIFTTYDQLAQKGSLRRELIQTIAPNATFVLDECDLGGGASGPTPPLTQKELSRSAAGEDIRSVSTFLTQSVLPNSNSYVLLSATAFKDPFVMTRLLYSKSEIRETGIDREALAERLVSQGIPGQQDFTNKLALSGELVRLEKSMEGITFQAEAVPVNLEAVDAASRITSKIVQFDRAKQEAVEVLRDIYAGAGSAIQASDGSAGTPSVDSTNFTSTAFNFQQQFLFFLKAEAVADRTIESIEAGRKPGIIFFNTMQAAIEAHLDNKREDIEQEVLEELQEENGGEPVPEEQVQEIARTRYHEWLRGEPAPEITLNLGDLLERQLDRSRMVTIKDAYGGRQRHFLTDEELGYQASALDNEIRLLCQNTDWSDIKISGVDAVLQRVEAAGYTIAEMSGRSLGIDYSTDTPRFREIDASKRDVRADAKNGFNNGENDALITNITTGWSGHASRGVRDQRQRETILAQAHPDGNKLVQSLGRFNRVGQVDPSQHEPDWTDEQGNSGWGEVRGKHNIAPQFGLPMMTMVYADGVAYEERITANINRKMASLNANTTGSRNSGVNLGDVDFLNPYGDQVAWDLMNDDPELHQKLDFPLGEPFPYKEYVSGAMARVTGRSLLLPLDEQRKLFDTLKQNFVEYIAQREAIGESPMEAKTLDLQAKTIGRIELAPAKSESLFAGATFVEVVQARSLRKPMTEEAAANQVRKSLGMDKVDEVPIREFEPNGEPRTLGKAAMEARIQAVQEVVENRIKSLDARIDFKKQRYEEQSPVIQKRLEDLHAQLKPLEEQQRQHLEQQQQVYEQQFQAIPEEDTEARDKLKKPEPNRELKAEIDKLNKAIKAENKAKTRLDSETNTYQEQQQKESVQERWKATKERLELCPVGQPVRVYDKELGSIYGIVTNVQRVEGIKNPLAGGAWKIKFALADGAREMTLKLSDINVKGKVSIDQAESAVQYKPPFDRIPVHRMFSELQQERFETRQIVTGNLLASPVGKKYINFTNSQGQVRQGLLLPRSYDIEEALEKMPVVLKTREQQQTFLAQTAGSGAKMQTTDEGIKIQHTTRVIGGEPQAGLLLDVPSSKKGGGKYFKDPDLMAVVEGGEFEKRSKGMQGFVPSSRIGQFLDVLQQKFPGQQLAVTDEYYKPIARELTGSEVQMMEWFKDDQPLDLAAQELEFSTEGIAARITAIKERAQQKKEAEEHTRQERALQSGDLDGAKPAGEAQKREIPQHPDLEKLVQVFEAHFGTGGRFDRITDARKFAITTLQDQGSDLAETLTNKQVDESIEKSLVRVARNITQSLEPMTSFDLLVDLYDRQPHLSSRTSSSILLQQYSTPTPIGRLAQQLGDIHPETTVYEPTAGNGSLLTNASPDKAIVNELDGRRASELQAQGFAVTQHDATEFAPEKKSVERVILNPPFGAVTDPATGHTKRWTIELDDPAPGTRPYETSAVDHAITFKSLSAMKDDGKAVVILGAPMEQKMGYDASGAYNEGQTRSFFFTLYNNYNVTQHFTVTGDKLYDKQGTTFPVDVIVIDGRGKSELPLPAVTPPPAYRTWEELRGVMAGSLGYEFLSRDKEETLHPEVQAMLDQLPAEYWQQMDSALGLSEEDTQPARQDLLQRISDRVKSGETLNEAIVQVGEDLRSRDLEFGSAEEIAIKEAKVHELSEAIREKLNINLSESQAAEPIDEAKRLHEVELAEVIDQSPADDPYLPEQDELTAESGLTPEADPPELVASPEPPPEEEAQAISENEADEAFFSVVATTESPYGELSVQIIPAVDDDEFYLLKFEGTTANWHGYPNVFRDEALPKSQFEQMEGFDSLQDYAQFAVEEVNTQFLVNLEQESDRILPSLKRWLKSNDPAEISDFLSQYPEADRHGISPELQKLVVQFTLESATPQVETQESGSAAVSETEPSRIAIQSLVTGERTYLDAPPLPGGEPSPQSTPSESAQEQTTESAQASAADAEPPRILPAREQLGQAEKNIAKLLNQAGLTTAIVEGILSEDDFHLRVENEPYLPLVIERHEDKLYLTHYRDYDGELVHDGEMVFQVQSTDTGDFRLRFLETAVQNPFSGGESRAHDRSFATVFSRNLIHQEFGSAALEAYTKQQSALEEDAEATVTTALPQPIEVQKEDRGNEATSTNDIGNLAETPETSPPAGETVIQSSSELLAQGEPQSDPEPPIPEQTAKVLSMTQQVMQQHDPQTLAALQQPEEEGWSPSLSQLRLCFIAAQSLGRDTSEIARIAEQVIAGTPEADKPKSERDPNFVNPDVRISGETLERMKSHIGDARAQAVMNNCHQILRDMGKPQRGNPDCIEFAKPKGDLIITFDRTTETLTAFSRKQDRILLKAVEGAVQEGQTDDMKSLKQKTTKFLEHTTQQAQQMA
ncbi:DUF6908 domain-containing protein [Leptolyngbya ohadii]|uniref:DUF6908 domain-containing protein n=1 Tax=Leptolyngbya ohadii TaxID=1962290 RepID=UPI000B59A988|nr:hypothetical protein [Leptolyngbya ohadii]